MRELAGLHGVNQRKEMNFYRGQKAPATRRQRRAKLLLAPRPWKSTESERSVEKIGEELQRYDTALSLSLSLSPSFLGEEEKRKALGRENPPAR